MGDKTRKEHESESAPPPPEGRRLNGSTPPPGLPRAAPPTEAPELQSDAPAAFGELAHEASGSGSGGEASPAAGARAGSSGNSPNSSPDSAQSGPSAYWRANITIVLILLAIWATVSFGFGIWLREPLDAFSIGGAPLGFWFAQQGAIYVFVVLIFVYVFLMERLDAKHHVEDESEMRRHHHTETSSS